jgi:hypothetical protein
VVSKGVQGSPFLGSILVRSLLLALLFVLSPFIRSDAQGPKSVFVKATCDGTLSVAVVSTFKEEIRTSKRYQLISTLDDNRRMDVVIDVRMSCVEQVFRAKELSCLHRRKFRECPFVQFQWRRRLRANSLQSLRHIC